jgi:uroporphyrinogen-III decarboxylase
MDFAAHNAMVTALWEAYGQGTNERVPVTFAIDEQYRLPRYGCGYREYYQSAELQLEVQLETDKLFRETVLHDREMGPPSGAWAVAPQYWMAEREYFGATVHFQENDYAWAAPLDLGKAALIERVRDVDPATRVREEHLFALYSGMKRAAEGREFAGRPVQVGQWVGTHGLFTIAAELRGLEQICFDLVEDPVFVDEYLTALTDALLGRMLAWNELLGSPNAYPTDKLWGGPDDSLQLLSERTCREQVLPHLRRLYDRMSTGRRTIHLCGKSQQHYKTLHDELNVTNFDGPGVHVDIGWMREHCAGPIEVNAQFNNTVLITGPPEAIEKEVARNLTPGAKAGKMNLMGYVPLGAQPEYLRLAYEYGKKHGQM